MPQRDPAEMLFEPTGDLAKDYSAYCEIEDKAERADIVDGIAVENVTDAAPANHKSRTSVVIRNLEYCLNKRDMLPLTSAIPHCQNLFRIHLTSCGLTEHSYKLLVEAVYKSPSVTSVAVDFNPDALFKDPTVSKKDRNEISVLPGQYRGAHLKHHEVEVKEDKKKADPKKAAVVQQAKEDQVQQEKSPIPIPSGWHAMLLTGVQQLSLRGNGINDKQVELLCPLLESASELLSLSLWGNCISNAGCQLIAAALKLNRKLTALNLGHNKIGDEGVAAIAQCFYTIDVTNEDAQKMRLKLLHSAELPQYPSYSELFQAPQAVAEDKKDPKKKEVAKGKKVEGPVERPKGEFDKDCVRLDELHVRIPGNTSLWGLNLTHNLGVTPVGVAAFITMLNSREPNYDQKENWSEGKVFPPYAAGIGIERIEMENPALEDEAVSQLESALSANIAARTLSPPKVQHSVEQ